MSFQQKQNKTVAFFLQMPYPLSDALFLYFHMQEKNQWSLKNLKRISVAQVTYSDNYKTVQYTTTPFK